MSTPRQQCVDHAKRFLGDLGALVEIKAYREHRFQHVVFRLTRADCVETYDAFSDGSGVGMTKTHTAPIEPPPLFSRSEQNE
jgi:hypothetical protein